MDQWDLSYITKASNLEKILDEGIISEKGTIYLFEDLYYRYKQGVSHSSMQYMWRYMAEKLFLCGELAICRINDDYLNGVSGILKQIEYSEPQDRFIWRLEVDRIDPKFIESYEIVNQIIKLTL